MDMRNRYNADILKNATGSSTVKIFKLFLVVNRPRNGFFARVFVLLGRRLRKRY